MTEKAKNDHVVSVLIAWVAVVLILSAIALGLERTESPNTIAVITLIGTLLIAPILAIMGLILKGARDDANSVKIELDEIRRAIEKEDV